MWALHRGPPHCTDEDTEARRRAAPGPEPTPPDSSFHPVGQVSPSAHWFTGEGDGQPPESHSKPRVFPQHQGASSFCFQCLWLTLAQGCSEAQEGVVPLESLQAQPASFRVTSGRFGLFQLGSVAAHCITRKDNLALLASSPFPRVCCAPCRSHTPFYLIPTLIS